MNNPQKFLFQKNSRFPENFFRFLKNFSKMQDLDKFKRNRRQEGVTFYQKKEQLCTALGVGSDFSGVFPSKEKVLVARDFGDRGAKNFAVMTFAELWTTISTSKTHPSLYEVIPNRMTPVKAFFDYDLPKTSPLFKKLETSQEKLDFIFPLIKELQSDFGKICDASESTGFDLSPIVYESCTENKISFHLIFPFVFFQNVDQHLEFYKQITPTDLNGLKLPKPYLDRIYTTFRSFRLPLCKKLSASAAAVKRFLYTKEMDLSSFCEATPFISKETGFGRQYFYASLITFFSEKCKSEWLNVPIVADFDLQKKAVTLPETAVTENRPNRVPNSSLFSEALDLYCVEAKPNVKVNLETTLGSLLARLPNHGDQNKTQGYDVRNYLKMFCHHWGDQRGDMDQAKKEWLLWLSNKNNYQQNYESYNSEWNSLVSYCSKQGFSSFSLDLSLLSSFVQAVEKKFGKKRKSVVTEEIIDLPDDDLQSITSPDVNMAIEEDSVLSPPTPISSPHYVQEIKTVFSIPFHKPKFFESVPEQSDRIKIHIFDLKELESVWRKNQNGIPFRDAHNTDILVEYYNLFCAKIHSLNSIILFKTLNPQTRQIEYKFLKEYPGANQKITVMTRGEDNRARKKTITLGTWLAEAPLGDLLNYQTLTFDTRMNLYAAEEVGCFNLFRGFKMLRKARKMQIPDYSKCKKILYHLEHNICHSEDELEKKRLFDHLLKMLAIHLLSPGSNTCGILIQGRSGCGKGQFYRIIKRLFGQNYTKYFVTLNQVFFSNFLLIFFSRSLDNLILNYPNALSLLLMKFMELPIILVMEELLIIKLKLEQ